MRSALVPCASRRERERDERNSTTKGRGSRDLDEQRFGLSHLGLLHIKRFMGMDKMLRQLRDDVEGRPARNQQTWIHR
jgi:hypothetical protein